MQTFRNPAQRLRMSESGSWLSITEAAAALGVSDDTVRRKLKAGTLLGRAEPTASGFRWQVNLDRNAPVAEPPTADTEPPAEGSAGFAVRLERLQQALFDGLASRDRQLEEASHALEREQAARAELAKALEREQVGAAELRVLLQRALERQPMIALPAAAPAVPTYSEAPPPLKQPASGWWATLREGNKGLGAGLTVTGVMGMVAGMILHFALRANIVGSNTHLGYVIGLAGLLSFLIGVALVF